jgi:tetratricopeptide (TPR) repeat protein
MATRDLLLLIGFLRSGKMYPTAVPYKNLPTHRSLKLVHEAMSEQERALFGKPSKAADKDDLRRRSALTSWTGEQLPLGSRIGEVPDPGVVLCLLYDGPVADATLPVDVFAQTLRRYALRDPALRVKFEEHVDEGGTYVPAWLSPEVRRKKSQEAFDAAMKVAREHGFAHAAPLFEGVRGDCFAPAQVAIAVYELRELADTDSALRRLHEVAHVAPRNVAARMQRARILMRDSGRKVEAATDYLAVLRELARPDTPDPSREVREAAMEGLWALHKEFANLRKLEAAVALAKQDPDRGFEALSRYVHTHPCAWDAQTHLATLALTRERFDLTTKLLTQVRWLFPDDPNPHFVYGQALASKGDVASALRPLEYAAELAPEDADIQKWLTFVRKKIAKEQTAGIQTPSVNVAHHVARSLLVLLGIARYGRVYPSAMVLHKLPGDVSLAFALQAIATQEQRRFGNTPADGPEVEIDLRTVNDRTTLSSWDDEPLSADQTVGDIPDPGIIVAVLYETVRRDDMGRPVFEPLPEECRSTLRRVAEQDSELHAKLDRHLKSPDATLKARLEI